MGGSDLRTSSISKPSARWWGYRMRVDAEVRRRSNRTSTLAALYRDAGPSRITPRTWSTDTGFHGNATRPQVAPAAA
jgi:hypothetical protein